MWKFMLFFLPNLKPTTGNNFKVFFEDVIDETPWKQTSCTKLRIQLIQVTCCGIGPLWKTWIFSSLQ